MNSKPWLIYSVVTTLTWGVWGALIEFPAKWGFPDTLGYIVWSLTMVPCAIVALKIAGWKLERDSRSIFLGAIVGLTGAAGQLILFRALREGPAYIIFPFVSLYPVLTILLSVVFLKERASRRCKWGIATAIVAIVLLSYQPPAESQSSSQLWLVLALLVFVLWGLQAFVMKFSNNVMSAEGIYFYMAVTALMLAPMAYAMTDWSRPVEWGLRGPYAAAAIQSLNSIGALFLVYALRYGKAIVVVPMTSLAPVITILLSLILYAVIPHPLVVAGMVVASIAIYLLALE